MQRAYQRTADRWWCVLTKSSFRPSMYYHFVFVLHRATVVFFAASLQQELVVSESFAPSEASCFSYVRVRRCV